MQETHGPGQGLTSARAVVVFDSDGTIFDSMEAKHRICYFPRLVKQFNLKPIEQMAERIWEEVNLYSRTRGSNRYLALSLFFEQLEAMGDLPDPVELPNLDVFRQWLGSTFHHSLYSLKDVQAVHREDPALRSVIAWSEAVNKDLRGKSFSRVFPHVREVLALLAPEVHVEAISQTPQSILMREWHAAGLSHAVSRLRGQEHGPKSTQLQDIAQEFPGKRLYVADSLADLAAAKEHGYSFFPIIPGYEEMCWKELLDKGTARFLGGIYNNLYEDTLVILLDELLGKLASEQLGTPRNPLVR